MKQGYYSEIATPREALYEAACAMDNQDVPLEDWPVKLIAAMTRDELLENFIYDKARGVLIWGTTNPLRMKFNGRVAGSLRKDGYLTVKLNRKDYLAHHLIWLAETGDLPTGGIKHKDDERTNNRFTNLFQVKPNKGYCWHKGAQAYIVYKRVEGKRVHLGYARSPYLAERILMEASNVS